MSQPNNNTAPANSLAIEDFTNHPDVQQCVAKLKKKFTASDPLIVSDVIDDQGNQYVNLVQKGGGVLGVALVGYTYILELMGIRFLRLAGTSAGAINTALMTVIGDKTEAKSVKILRAICDLNFFDLVDGHPAARRLIKTFITHEDFSVKVKKLLTNIMLVLAGLFLCDFVLLGLENKYIFLSMFTRISFVLTGFYLLLLAVIVYHAVRLLKRLKDSGFGINPGDFFYDWIKNHLKENGVNTVSDLNKKASTLPAIKLREPSDDHPEGIEGLKGDVTFITSELVTQNKIQFPEMCYLFKEKKDIDKLQPAGFIRASMSIPVFFESYMINEIPCTSPEIKQAWIDTFDEHDAPSTARFVDGGILSNFPINLFYNPRIIVPRVPSFGINLDDTKKDDNSKHAATWSLGGYASRMFNTIRDYYDKDFLLKNKVYEKGIGTIRLENYNWLNFFIKDKDKIDMFVLGAQAATDFLLEFKWNDYKNARTDLQIKLNEQKPPASATDNPTSTI